MTRSHFAVRCRRRRGDGCALIERIKAMTDGAPDVIVNNAGAFKLVAGRRRPAGGFPPPLDVNLVAPFVSFAHFFRDMRKRADAATS